MTKLLTVVALTIGLLGLSPVGHADAANRCVTKAEYRKVNDGMRKARVHRIFDTSGRRTVLIGSYERRVYKTCIHPSSGFVRVVYVSGHVDSKSAMWG
jgi:hypothetical protein